LHSLLGVGLPAPQRVDVDAELTRGLAVVRLAIQRARQLLLRGRDLALLPPDAARHVVVLAQIVEDRAADAGRRVRAERQAAPRVEALDRVDQADAARTDEVVQLDLYAERAQDLSRHVMHERQMLREQLIARGFIAMLLKGVPERRRFHGLQFRMSERVRRASCANVRATIVSAAAAAAPRYVASNGRPASRWSRSSASSGMLPAKPTA